MLNNVYCYDKNYHTSDIKICVFPLDNKSVIFCFVEYGNKIYHTFYKSVKKMNKEDRLHLLLYIILLYSENYFISPKIDKEILKSEKIIDVCKKTNNQIATIPIAQYYNLYKNFNLNSYSEIPNLFLEKYKV